LPINDENPPHSFIRKRPAPHISLRAGDWPFSMYSYINNTPNPMPRKISRIDSTMTLLFMVDAS
jgi:hypothetical protein